MPTRATCVRLLLAREKGIPKAAAIRHDLLVPLQEDGRLDETSWKSHQGICRVRSFKGRRRAVHTRAKETDTPAA